MPKCKKCGKKGFFLPTFGDGYCKLCFEEIQLQKASEEKRILEESAKALEARYTDQEDRLQEVAQENDERIKQAAEERLSQLKSERFAKRMSRSHICPSEIYCGEKLKYQYEDVKIFTPDDLNVRVLDFNIGDTACLQLEPHNIYDSKAVLVKSNNNSLGYIYRGTIQDMVHDWKEKELPIWCVISDIDDESHTFWLDIAFYKTPPRTRPVKIFRLIGNKSEEMQENIAFSSEGEIISYNYDFERDKYEAISGDILGYFPASANELLEAESAEAYIKEICTDDNGKYIIKVAVEYDKISD